MNGIRPRWLCPLCGRLICEQHFKRHLWKHDREGRRGEANVAWVDFLVGRGRRAS